MVELVRIALRNLRLHWVRTLIVGILLVTGSFVFLVGQSVLGAVGLGMRSSVINSLSGDVQVYSAAAREPLELYGSFAMGVPDLGQIDDFGKVRDALMASPAVKSVVQMGLHKSVVWGNTMIDIKLQELRKAVTAKDAAAIAPLKQHVRLLTRSLETELDKLELVAARTDDVTQQRADLSRAQSEAFWAEFDRDPLESLEFLDNRIAPLGLESNMYFLQYVGTDPQAFAKNFELLEIIDGEMIPPGQRGFLFNTLMYERNVKHPVARGLDQIRDALEADPDKTIAEDPDLQRLVERNVQQVTKVTDQVEPGQIPALVGELQKELGSAEADLGKLVQALLTLDDASFRARYEAFYRVVAPRIRLYAFRVGETLTLQSQTKSGYLSAVNVKIYGVFRFKGLEKATLAGFTHIMDMATLRDLYGLTSATSAAEVAALKQRAGASEVTRDNAIDALFGEDAEDTDTAGFAKPFDETAGADLAGLRRAAEAAAQAGYTQEEMDRGPCLNIAVFLKDGADLERGVPAVQAALAGLGVQAVPWTAAQGRFVGGIVTGVTAFFYISVLIFMFVVGIIILLGLVLSTMQRTREIGTMRAIGATRGFVIRMIGVEALTMGALFGLGGVLLGGLILWLVDAGGGVPASSDLEYFIFGGAALHPLLTPAFFVTAFLVGIVVTFFASLIPAFIASRIRPIVAMQAKE